MKKKMRETERSSSKQKKITLDIPLGRYVGLAMTNKKTPKKVNFCRHKPM